MRTRSTLAFVAVVLLAAATPGASAAPAQATRKAQWTLLYYVDADNDREAERLEHVEHMAAVGSTEDVNVIVLIDRNANDNTHVYPEDVAEDGPLLNLGDFDDAKLLKVEKGSLTVLQELGEIDMGSPQTLSWFLATGFRSYPAEHYAAVIDDHGGGIIGASWDDSTPADAAGHGSYLSIPDITQALDAAFAKTGVDKIDLFGFNACLMGNVDVALKLAPYADYLVASEEMTNGRQWNDEAVIRAATVPGATGADLGKAVADNQDGADFWQRRTYSVLDLRKMGAVEQALASFADAVRGAGRGALSQLGRARARTIHFGLLSAEEDAALFDIGDLIAHLEGVPDAVTTAGNALYEAVRQATVTVVSGPLSQPATGLAIVFPDRADGFPFDYAPFAAVPEWSDALDDYYAAGPQPTFASTTATVTLVQGGALSRADLADGTETSVVTAESWGGVVQPDGRIHFLFQSPGVLGSGSAATVAGSWDFSYFKLSDEATSLDATTHLSPVPEGLRASIPLIYQDPTAKQWRGALEFTLRSDGTVGDFNLFGTDSAGATTDLMPSPGAIVAPLVYTVSPGGEADYVLANDAGLDATKLGLVPSNAPAGATFVMALFARDSAGRAAVASGAGIVPAD